MCVSAHGIENVKTPVQIADPFPFATTDLPPIFVPVVEKQNGKLLRVGDKIMCVMIRDLYTLSHPENDRDVTERAQGYTPQDAVFMRQSLR